MQCTITDFIHNIFDFDNLPADERVCLTLKHDDGTWSNYPASPKRLARYVDGSGAWYFGVSTYQPPDDTGYFPRDRDHARFAYCLVLDDIGTKAAEPPVAPSWVLESSPGNYQWGYLIEPVEVSDPGVEAYYEGCQRAVARAGYTDEGARGTYRVMRVPGSLHRTGFVARVTQWHPDRVWVLAELMSEFGLEPLLERERRVSAGGERVDIADVVDPVLDWLSGEGHTTGVVGRKFVEVVCPWACEHTSGGDTAGYTPAGYGPREFDHAFSCLHEHCSGRGKQQFLDWVASRGGPDPRVAHEREPEEETGEGGFRVPDIRGLPDLVGSPDKPSGRQVVTTDNVVWLLGQLGIEPALNMMTASSVLRCPGYGESHLDQIQLRRVVLDMATRLRIHAHQQLEDVLSDLAHGNPYHPMEDWLAGLPAWDGVDHIGQLAATVSTSNPLWPVYLENWLIQTVHGVCGWRGGAQRPLSHVLTLVGGQGVGKSRWLERLGGPFFKGEAELHLSSPGGKDHQLEVLRYPMAELSELDGIFRKTDIALMKSFITRGVDSIRAPYERRALVRPRMTSFCASVNEAEFLSDPSGSRRFWPVMVESIDWHHGVDFGGVWGQAYALWCADSNFDLTAEQDAQRAAIALDQHTMVHAEEEVIEEYLRCHVGDPRYPEQALNRSEILSLLFGRGRNFSPVQISTAGRCISKHLGPHKTIDGKQRCWRFPYNPNGLDRETWPKVSHLRLVASDKNQVADGHTDTEKG
jgi:hypothetical protein